MATTDGLKLPIPELTDTADGPNAISLVVNAVEDYAYDRILPVGVTRWPTHHWGAGTVFPSGTSLKPGDTYRHTGLLSLMAYDGTSWYQIQGPANMTQAQRQAMVTNYSAQIPKGFQVYETDFNRVISWNGSYFRLTRPEVLTTGAHTANSLISNGWAGTTYAWTSGLGAKVTVANDGIYRDITAMARIQVANAEGWVRLTRDGDATVSWPNATGLKQSVAASSEVMATVYATDFGVVNVVRNYYLEVRAAVSGGPSFFAPQLIIEAK